MKKIIIFVLLLTLCFTATAFANDGDIKVYLDGNPLKVTTAPVIENGTTLVPMRSIFEALGVSVDWDSATKTIIGRGNRIIIELTVGQNKARVNGAEKQLAVPAKILNGNTMVPLRFVSEAVGATVDWNANAKTITIKSQNGTTSSGLYAVEATGKYAGYMMLKGYPDEDKFLVYFKGDANSFSVKYEETRNIDLNEVILWKYQGKTYSNTRSELYSFFSDTTWFRNNLGMLDYTLTEQWFKDTFGNVYWDWAAGIGYSAEAARLVTRYFEETQPAKVESFVTLTPDTEVVIEKQEPEKRSAEDIIGNIQRNSQTGNDTSVFYSDFNGVVPNFAYVAKMPQGTKNLSKDGITVSYAYDVATIEADDLHAYEAALKEQGFLFEESYSTDEIVYFSKNKIVVGITVINAELVIILSTD